MWPFGDTNAAASNGDRGAGNGGFFKARNHSPNMNGQETFTGISTGDLRADVSGMPLGSYALARFAAPSDHPPRSAGTDRQKAQQAAAGRELDAAEAIMGDGRAPEPAPIGRLHWESVLGF